MLRKNYAKKKFQPMERKKKIILNADSPDKFLLQIENDYWIIILYPRILPIMNITTK